MTPRLRHVSALGLILWGGAGFGCAGTTLTQSADLEMTRKRQEEVLAEVQQLKEQQASEAERALNSDADVLLAMDDLEARLDRIESQLKDLLDGIGRTQMQKTPPPIVPPVADTTASPTVDPRSQYEAAYLEVTRGHYDVAIQAFDEFLRQHPSTDLSDNAVYWIGECYYAQGDYNRAIEAFVRLMDTYPQGDKVPAAMLKLGYAFAANGDPVAARRYLEALISKHPDSEEAALARTRLGEL